jgi:hypothetical protein
VAASGSATGAGWLVAHRFPLFLCARSCNLLATIRYTFGLGILFLLVMRLGPVVGNSSLGRDQRYGLPPPPVSFLRRFLIDSTTSSNSHWSGPGKQQRHHQQHGLVVVVVVVVVLSKQ